MAGGSLGKLRQGAWTIRLADGCEQGPTLSAVKHFCQAFPAGVEKIGSASGLWKVHGGGRSTIYGAEFAGEKYCLKLFTDNRLQTRARTFLGWSKGRRAFANGVLAREKDIPVPPVYAYAERRPFGPSMVVMKLLDAVQMNLLIEDMLARGAELPTDPLFNRMVESFALFTRHLHEQAACHDDFSPRNVLVAVEGERIRLSLIDLEDIVFSGRAADFQANIEHFHRKMARYVKPDALEMFQKKFREGYGDPVNR